jgi:hypothetical protein
MKGRGHSGVGVGVGVGVGGGASGSRSLARWARRGGGAHEAERPASLKASAVPSNTSSCGAPLAGPVGRAGGGSGAGRGGRGGAGREEGGCWCWCWWLGGWGVVDDRGYGEDRDTEGTSGTGGPGLARAQARAQDPGGIRPGSAPSSAVSPEPAGPAGPTQADTRAARAALGGLVTVPGRRDGGGGNAHGAAAWTGRRIGHGGGGGVHTASVDSGGPGRPQRLLLTPSCRGDAGVVGPREA